MKHIWLRNLLAVGMVIAMFAFSGCANISGGGWMDSAMMNLGNPQPSEPLQEGEIMPKATFGFQFTCTPTGDYTAEYQGHITYHDHGSTFVAGNGKVKKLAFQANTPLATSDWSDLQIQPCDAQLFFDYGYYQGTYTAIPPNAGDPGTFEFFAWDGGETGPDKFDWFEIELEGGVLDGYENSGIPGGGNIHLP